MNTFNNIHIFLSGLHPAASPLLFPALPRAARCFAAGLLCLGLTLGTFAPALHAEEKAAEADAPVKSDTAAPSAPAKPTSDGTRELWTGKLYASTYRAGVCLKEDGSVRGVLLLTVPSGKVDVYHFHGRHQGGRVSATHTSGHTFEGLLENEQVVSGTIRLKSGFTVDMKGQRTHHVELTETCRPLPE